MEKFLNYRILTNSKYRIITNLLIPILVILPSIIMIFKNDIFIAIGISIMYFIFMMCEFVGDYFCFGCMCRKNVFGMDFLKTGYRGIEYFEDAILVDIVIRPIRIGIVILIGAIPFIKQGISIWPVFYLIIISAIMSVAALNVTRYIGMASYTCIVSSIFTILGGMAMYALVRYAYDFRIILAPVFALLLIGVIAGTYYHMSIRVSQSYSDC